MQERVVIMGIFGGRKKKSTCAGDVSALFPLLVNDRRTPGAFRDYHTAAVVWEYDSMVDSVKILLKTNNPSTFFYRYDLAIEQAQRVYAFGGTRIYGKDAKETYDALRKHKATIANAFLKRCYEAGKFPYVRREIVANRKNMPKESWSYFEKLLELSDA